MFGRGALGQYPLGGGPTGLVAPTEIRWFAPLSTPVRFKRTPREAVAVNNQYFAFNPQPVVSFGWFGSFSEPARRRKFGLPPYEQPVLAFNPRPFVSFGWYGELSKPQKLDRPGLRASLQQFTTLDTAVIPLTKLMQWFGNLSEPVREKVGLKAPLQMSYAGPVRLMPNPSVSGIMSALETKDVFLGGAAVFNRPQSGELGVVEDRSTGGEIGLSREPAPISARMSISIV